MLRQENLDFKATQQGVIFKEEKSKFCLGNKYIKF